MRNETPFDVWDGEGLESSPASAELAPEEAALHVVDDDDVTTEPHAFTRAPEHDPRPVEYFEDEEPEEAPDPPQGDDRPDEHEPDLEEVLETQHYS